MKKITIAVFVVPPLLVVSYLAFILFKTWPVTSWSIAQAGVLGDSFGILTCLFSGWAFGGMVLTLKLQSDELKEQRIDSLTASRLHALSAIAQIDACSANLTNNSITHLLEMNKIVDDTEILSAALEAMRNSNKCIDNDREKLDITRAGIMLILNNINASQTHQPAAETAAPAPASSADS